MNWLTSSVFRQRFPSPRRSAASLGAALLTATAAIVVVAPSPALAVDCPTEGPVSRVTGDWDGDGVDTVGIVDQNYRWALRNSNTAGAPDLCFRYGANDSVPKDVVVGDWDGDGTDTVGLVVGRGHIVIGGPTPARPLEWHLRNSNSAGVADLVFEFGTSSGTPVTGDWDGDGDTNIGFVQDTGTHLRWNLRRYNSAGRNSATFNYGVTRLRAAVGDWDGDGTDTVGVTTGYVDSSTFRQPRPWHLRNSNTAGGADLEFEYGEQGEPPVVGDWDGNGTDTPGVTVMEAVGEEEPFVMTYNIHWFLRNSASTGGPHRHFVYGLDRLPNPH